MDSFQAQPRPVQTLCTGYYYSWPCGHTEDLGDKECMFAEWPNLQNHAHLRQNLGNPGYECPVCPQQERPAPTYYPPVAEHPSFDRIAALQWQLDAFMHNQVREGRLPESSLPPAEWGRVPARENPYWGPPQADTRLRLDRAAAILQRWPETAREGASLQQPNLNPATAFRGEFVPDMAWSHEHVSRREALRLRTQWVRRTQIRQEQRAAEALQRRSSHSLARGFLPAPPIQVHPSASQAYRQPPHQVNRPPPTQANHLPLHQFNQYPPVDAQTDPGFRRYLELLDEMQGTGLAEGSRR